MEYNFRGQYDATQSYAIKDVVSFQSTLPATYVKYYMCLIPNDSSNPASPDPYSDNASWGEINSLSNFPNSVDSFLYRTNIQGNDKVDIARINELTLKTSLTTTEQDELTYLTSKHRNKLFQADDLNAIQDSLSNLQIFFKDKVDAKLNSNISSIQTVKDSALVALDNKKNSIDLYLDSTTAGALRTDLGVMSDLTTTNKTSLVKAVNELKSTLPSVAFKTVLVGGVSLVADSNADILQIVAGNGISISADANSDSFTIDIKNPTWTNLTLQNGVTAFALGSEPIFTKIGNVVYIKGAVTNISAVNTIIGTLPSGYRPSIMSHNFVQATSTVNSSARVARWVIGLDGTIKLEGTTDALYNASYWYPVHTSFIVG
jgi:hypothetical protein